MDRTRVFGHELKVFGIKDALCRSDLWWIGSTCRVPATFMSPDELWSRQSSNICDL
jgi:hypothetical protein